MEVGLVKKVVDGLEEETTAVVLKAVVLWEEDSMEEVEPCLQLQPQRW